MVGYLEHAAWEENQRIYGNMFTYELYAEELYSAERWRSLPGFGCMPGISGGIFGDFSSGWRLFPKMPGDRFGVVECSNGGGDLNGLLGEKRGGGVKSNLRL